MTLMNHVTQARASSLSDPVNYTFEEADAKSAKYFYEFWIIYINIMSLPEFSDIILSTINLIPSFNITAVVKNIIFAAPMFCWARGLRTLGETTSLLASSVRSMFTTTLCLPLTSRPWPPTAVMADYQAPLPHGLYSTNAF